MASSFDPSDFVDTELESARKGGYTGAGTAASTPASRPPTREEIDGKVADAQTKLAELKRAQEELERERAVLEETRRRQAEFSTSREEMLQNLTRGLGLLEESEFAARRDAEQMSRSIADLKEALRKVQAIREEAWSKENYSTELTRALTVLENARMEWNAARLKFAVLAGAPATSETRASGAPAPAATAWTGRSFLELSKIGLAFTWPLVLLGLGIFAVLLFRH